MNILFFLTPKSDVAYISEDDTLRQALELSLIHIYSPDNESNVYGNRYPQRSELRPYEL